jgi:hypothetical protein
MSSKHRTYPVLPALYLKLPNGQRVELKPVLCTAEAAEMTLVFSLGVAGDLVTHSYTLSLGREVEEHKIEPQAIFNIAQIYADRVSAKIKLDAVLRGTDLWLRKSTYAFASIEPIIKTEAVETWMRMAAGVIREDQVHLSLLDDGEKVVTAMVDDVADGA